MCPLSNKFALLIGLMSFGLDGLAHAEKADRDKPIHIESDKLSLDNANRVSIFEGKVELTQGTLRVIAEKAVVTEDAAGNKFCVATGHLASFRQKRDEANEYVEGFGERIEYSTLPEKIDLYVRARVKREQDDVRGDHITYNTQTEIFRVNSPQNTGRVRATLQPKAKETKTPPPKTAEPVKSGTKETAASSVSDSKPVAVSVQKASEVTATDTNSIEPKAVEPGATQPSSIEPAASEPAPATKQP